jgi:hypothetical protein
VQLSEVLIDIARPACELLTRQAGEIIAEFADGRDALAFCRAKGREYTVTPGIHLLYAVRRVKPP